MHHLHVAIAAIIQQELIRLLKRVCSRQILRGSISCHLSHSCSVLQLLVPVQGWWHRRSLTAPHGYHIEEARVAAVLVISLLRGAPQWLIPTSQVYRVQCVQTAPERIFSPVVMLVKGRGRHGRVVIIITPLVGSIRARSLHTVRQVRDAFLQVPELSGQVKVLDLLSEGLGLAVLSCATG